MQTWKEKYENIFKPFFNSKLKLEHNTKAYKYDNVAKLAHIICDWMIDRRENGQGISNIALCNHLGITRPTLDNMRGYSEDFKNLIDITKGCIEEYWVDCLGNSESAAKFILSGMQGYTEITKQIIESDNFIINIKKPS